MAILECQIAKNQNGFIQETFWHKVGSISTTVLEIVSFHVYLLFLVTAPCGHLGHQFEIVPFKESKPCLPENANFTTIYFILRMVYTYKGGKNSHNMVCLHLREIIHELKLVDYLHIQADKP